MWQTVRIVEKLKPKYVVWENVKNVLSKKHIHNFNKYLEMMEDLGYTNYHQVLNSKDYGIPQNRERVFTISILNNDMTNFNFPEKQELKLKLKDLLEDEVDEKYYIKSERVSSFTIPANPMSDKGQLVVELPGAYGRNFGSKGKLETDICSTLTAAMGAGGGNVPLTHIATEGGSSFLKKHYDNFKNKNGYIPEMFNPYNESEITEIAPTQSTQCGSTTSSATVLKSEGLRIRKLTSKIAIKNEFRIRKLTPREVWRLMGFSDEEFKKASLVNSDTQLYKQAGNSIVVDVLVAIFKNLFSSLFSEEG